jgi:thiamine-phosphate pyrophosphorylase
VNELAQRRLYLCTPNRDDLLSFVESVIDGGVDVVQLRDKFADAKVVVAVATPLAALCRERGVPFILNDRPDLALEVGADGVHVGQDDASVRLCRRLLGPNAIIGLSTHADADLELALAEDTTYLSAGPVVATPTKPGRPGVGVEYAARATSRSRPQPVFVTGGVTPTTVPALAAAGVEHFVVVRYLTEASNGTRAASALRRAIDEALS